MHKRKLDWPKTLTTQIVVNALGAVLVCTLNLRLHALRCVIGRELSRWNPGLQ